MTRAAACRGTTLAILLCTVVPPLLAQTPEPPSPWDLSRCLRYAMKHSPRLQAEAHRVQAAEEGLTEARAGDDPRTVVSGGATAQAPAIAIHLDQGRVVQVAPATQATLAVQAVLPLDISHYWRSRRIGASHAWEAQRESYRQAEEQLLLDTIAAYYRVLTAQAGRGAAHEALAVAESEYARMEARLAAGAATPALLTVAEAARVEARGDLVSVETALRDARAVLATTLGLPLEEAPEVVDAPLELDTSMPWEEARDVAIQERPELKALSHTAGSLGASADAIRASQKPSLSLTAGAGLATPGGLSSPSRSIRAGLSFSWPISGNGAARAQARSAEERQQGVLQDLEQTRLGVETQVYSAIDRLTSLAAALNADRADLTQAEALARQARLRLAEGMATSQDVAARECAVTAATARLHADECDLSVARAEWARALGILSRLVLQPAAPTPTVQEATP
jgi:outer membrane protein TolC